MQHSRMSTLLLWFALLALGVGSAVTAYGASKPRTHAAGSDSTLASQARVSMATAKATALARVPGGKINSSELEREKGKLIYSFDVMVPGKPGIEEVNVDAIDGHVVSVAHEGPKAERKEAKQDRTEAHRDSVKAAKARSRH